MCMCWQDGPEDGLVRVESAGGAGLWSHVGEWPGETAQGHGEPGGEVGTVGVVSVRAPAHPVSQEEESVSQGCD